MSFDCPLWGSTSFHTQPSVVYTVSECTEKTVVQYHMSRDTTKPTKLHVCPSTETQISLEHPPSLIRVFAVGTWRVA